MRVVNAKVSSSREGFAGVRYVQPVHSTSLALNMTVPKILATALVAVTGLAAKPWPSRLGRWWSCSPARAARPARRPTSCSPSSHTIPASWPSRLPVDYWDYLGWKDTLADKAFTERQKAYGESARRPAASTRRKPWWTVWAMPSARIARRSSPRRADGDGAWRAEQFQSRWSPDPRASRSGCRPRPSRQGPRDRTVFLPVLKRTEVAIGRGENKGHTITYTNIVREVVSLGPVDGEPGIGRARRFRGSAATSRPRCATPTPTSSWSSKGRAGAPPGLILGPRAKGPGL